MIIFFRIRVWICGRWRKNRPWVFQGVFFTKKRAVRECIDREYFVAPAILNEPLPRDVRTWPGAYYPRAEFGFSPKLMERIENKPEKPPALPTSLDPGTKEEK